MNTDHKSIMGYRKDSPYKNLPFIDIHTPGGLITTRNMAFPIMANGVLLKPNTGMYKFNNNIVRETPVKKFSTSQKKYQLGATVGNNKTNPAYEATWEPRIWQSVNTYQKGGRTPIITDNKNDPRLRAYQDSLSSYNTGKQVATNLGKQIDKKYGSKDYEEYYTKNYEAGKLKYPLGNNSSLYGSPYLPPLNSTQLDTEIDYWNHRYDGENGIGINIGNELSKLKNNKVKPYRSFSGSELPTAQLYKKPVQPIIYKKPEPEIKRLKRFNILTDNNIVGLPVNENFIYNKPQINIGEAAMPNLPYRVEYQDENGQNIHQDFENEQVGIEFQQSLFGNRKGYYKFQQGGFLPKAQLGKLIPKMEIPRNATNGYKLNKPNIPNWLNQYSDNLVIRTAPQIQILTKEENEKKAFDKAVKSQGTLKKLQKKNMMILKNLH